MPAYLIIICLLSSIFLHGIAFRVDLSRKLCSTYTLQPEGLSRKLSMTMLAAKRRSSRLTRKNEPSEDSKQDDDEEDEPESQDLLISSVQPAPVTKPATPLYTTSIQDELRADIDRLQRKPLYDPLSKSTASDSSSSSSPLGKLNDIFSIIFIADFFVIIVFLVWFLAAVTLQSVYPDLLLSFQNIFQPVVVPALTVLMVGSIASGIGGQINKPKEN